MPKQSWFSGIFPALITPFDKNDEIDEEAFRKLLRHLTPNVSGVVPCGTTGEFVYLSEKEKQRIFDITIDELSDKVPTIAGTGCTSTKQTIELTQYAKDAGARAALIVTPFYLKPTFKP